MTEETLCQKGEPHKFDLGMWLRNQVPGPSFSSHGILNSGELDRV